MHLHIEHSTRYRFGRPVFLEPHTLRLTPRGDLSQRLKAVSLVVHPTPQAMTGCLDAFGNAVHRCWFLEMTDVLEIRIVCEVETLRENPFDFLPEPLDRLTGTRAWEALAPALVREFQAPAEVETVSALAGEIWSLAGEEHALACTRLCGLLHGRIEKVLRLEPGVQSPAETLRTGRGACRDMALLFMDCCRARGLPARFVSGYQLPAMGEGEGEDAWNDARELHAWAEVYLPGGGWRGYDPTHGLLVADRHVALAAAPHWEDAMPVTGSFRGDVASELEHVVRVREVEAGGLVS